MDERKVVVIFEDLEQRVERVATCGMHGHRAWLLHYERLAVVPWQSPVVEDPNGPCDHGRLVADASSRVSGALHTRSEHAHR